MKKLFILVGVAALAAVSANAALTAPTIATSDFEAVAGAVLTASGIFYGIRRALGLLW